MHKLFTIFLALTVLLSLGACSAMETTGGTLAQASIPVVEAKAPVEGAITVADAAADGQYPDSPEAVVQAFLTAYGLSPDGMTVYLSSTLQSSLPSGSPAELVSMSGMLEGFAIHTATVDPTAGEAQVTAAMRVGGVDAERTFSLILENGRWLINSLS